MKPTFSELCKADTNNIKIINNSMELLGETLADNLVTNTPESKAWF
jgi:hypothetical protein